MLARLGAHEVFYLRHGRGAPLLVMHGGPGLGHAYFRPYLDALGADHELIYYDHRGNGRSAGREALGGMTVESWADDAEALRQTLKLGPVVVLGHGFGGFIAQAYARRHPGALRGLILCNTSPALDYPASMLTRARDYASQEALAAMMACMCAPSRDDASFAEHWRRALPSYFYRYQPVYGAAMGEGMQYSAMAYNRGMFELAPSFHSVDWLHELTCPTLIVGGAHDWLAPRQEGIERLAAGIAGSEVQLFEHSGHYPFVEETTTFCHRVRHFLRALPLGP